MGTSIYRDTLEELVANPPGTANLCFFMAVLFPYNTNPHDPEAVAVTILDAPKQLGHLPRELARAYRARMAEQGLEGPSACSAVISGGLRNDEREDHFAVEIDLDLERSLQFEEQMRYPEPLRQTRVEWLESGESHVIRCWLSEPAECLYRKWNVNRWDRPEWAEVGYYVDRAQGGGYGMRLFGVPKAEDRRLFGKDPVDGEIISIDGRWATVYLDRVTSSNPAPRERRGGGRPVRSFFVLQDKLRDLAVRLQQATDPDSKLAVALAALETQYELETCGRQPAGPDQTIKEAALVGWEILSTSYIGKVVRGLVAQGKIDQGAAELARFLARAPHQRGNRVVVSLEKILVKGKINSPRSRKAEGVEEEPRQEGREHFRFKR